MGYELYFNKKPYIGETEVSIYNNIVTFGKTVLNRTGNEKLDD